MRDQKYPKLYTLKDNKLFQSKADEILSFINHKLFKSLSPSFTNSNFDSFQHFSILVLSLQDKINILVNKINKMDARMRTKFKDAHDEPLFINNQDLLQDKNIEKVIDKKSESINLELQKDLKVNSNLHILNSDLDSKMPQIITPKTEN